MNNIVISTGALCRCFFSLQEKLRFIKKNFENYGIEIIAAKLEELPLDIQYYIDELNYKTFHLSKYVDCENYTNYLKINFDYLICHVNELDFFKYKIINQKLLVENLEFTHEEIPENLKICCDISHCLSISKKYFEKFLQENYKRIYQFHISDYREEKNHRLLFQSFNLDKIKFIKEMLEKYECINKKFVIESLCDKKEDLHNEVFYLQKHLFNL